MQIVLLSGGSGKRLWPLSNNVRSKQFLQLFKNQDGQYCSMLQRVCGQIRANNNSPILIATNKTQVSAIKNQLHDQVKVCVEPCRRDTFPAIALSCAYLHDVLKVKLNECVVVCPVDPYVEAGYFKTLNKLEAVVQQGQANLVLMGIEPNCPSEKFGYILPRTKDEISDVAQFKEKPKREVAETYLQQGAVWNAGVFAFKLGYLLEVAHDLIDFKDYHDLLAKYETVKKISFDYAIVEHEDKIKMVRYQGCWNDIGTWNALTEVMDDAVIGDAVIDDQCKNLHVVNELGLPVVAMGLENCVIATSRDGILVANKDVVDGLKPYVENLPETNSLAEKSWGKFEILHREPESLTVKLMVAAGKQLTEHQHAKHDEIWTVLSGTGTATVDGKDLPLTTGTVVTIKRGNWHTLRAETTMQIIEVQVGTLDARDKVKKVTK